VPDLQTETRVPRTSRGRFILRPNQGEMAIVRSRSRCGRGRKRSASLLGDQAWLILTAARRRDVGHLQIERVRAGIDTLVVLHGSVGEGEQLYEVPGDPRWRSSRSTVP
jgi:hypothetical protein